MKFRQKPASGIWLVDYDDAGVRKRVSTGIKTAPMKKPPPEVQQAGREIVLGLRDPVVASSSGGKARKPSGLVTMSDLFDRCEKTVWAPTEVKSQATIRSNIKILRPLIGDVAVGEMNYSRLEKLIEELRGMGYAPGTIKRKLDMVSKALRMATRWTDSAGRPLLVSKPPLPPLRVDNLKDRILFGAADARLMGVADEEALIFEAIDERRVREPGRQWFRIAALVRFLLDAGGRLTESINSGEQDIQFQPVLVGGAVVRRPVIVFPRYGTKSDKPRAVPLTDAAWSVLQSQRPHIGLRKVEIRAGEKIDKLVFFPMTQSSVWYMFDTIKDDIKAKHGVDLSDVTLHTLRHTCLSRLAQSGSMDLLRLQRWAGHSDPKITAERYAHLMPSNLMDGLLALGSSNGGMEETHDSNNIRPAIVPVPETGANRATPGAPAIH